MMSEFSKLTSLHRLKKPSITIHKGKKQFKNKLEINHHNYNLSIAAAKDYLLTVETTNKLKSSYSESSKPLNKRKVFRYTSIQSDHLVKGFCTPAVKMIDNISKRSRETYDYKDLFSGPSPKKRRKAIDAGTFIVEPVVEAEWSFKLKKLFDVDTETKNRKVDDNIPDHNENLVTSTSPETKQDIRLNIGPAPIDLKSEIVPVSTSVDSSNSDYKLPVDGKFKFNCSSKFGDESFTDPVDLMDVETSAEVKTERECEKISSVDVPLKTYVGQLLWARCSSFPFWPAIVHEANADATKDTVKVRFFANKGQRGECKRKDVFEFDGMDSFVQHKKTWMTKPNISKSDKAAFNINRCLNKFADAVAEGLYVLSVDLDMRLAFFDIIAICSLHDSIKNPGKLSARISAETNPFHLEAVEKLFEENPNIWVDLKQKLSEMASKVDVSLQLPKIPAATSAPKLTSTKPKVERRYSEPAIISERRMTLRNVAPKSDNESERVQLPSIEALVPEEEAKKIPNIKVKRTDRKCMEFEKDLDWYFVTAAQTDILFKGLPRGNVCKICLSSDKKSGRDLVKCAASCGDNVHSNCARATKQSNVVICHDCIDLSTQVCYVCKKPCSESVVRCTHKNCGRHYHKRCLADWPQTEFVALDKILCPLHVCHICTSDETRNKNVSTTDSKLTRCLKCPTTYCIDSSCIPAGVKILTNKQHICLRHRIERRKPVYNNWCYICGGPGGNFMCCDACPLTAHRDCLPHTVDSENYLCDNCETGRSPLYGDLVWTKYSTYRFWPSVVVPPACIPEKTMNEPHEDFDICVRFFGTYDFGLVERHYLFLYEDDDIEKAVPSDAKLNKGIKEIDHWCRVLKVRKSMEVRKPVRFTAIKRNVQFAGTKVTKKESESHRCSCSPDDIDPCGPTSSCSNRACCVECEPDLCPCGDKCNNQCIEKRQYANFSVRHMGDKGFGLIADSFIFRGALICEYVGEIITEEVFRSRLAAKQNKNYYYMRYGKGLYIDAERKGNMARFMNHSCEPNCRTVVLNVKGVQRIGLFAWVDITEGTELTFDYDFEGDNHKCYCGAKECRGIIGKKVGGTKVAGTKVAGTKVAGPKVAGTKVAGAKVGGTKEKVRKTCD